MDSRTGGSFGPALGVPPETCSSSSALSSLLVDSCLFVAAVLIAVIMKPAPFAGPSRCLRSDEGDCSARPPRRCDGHHGFAVCGSGLASGRSHHPGEGRPAEAPAIPGEIIPEWWATSSRNGGRNYLGMGGRHQSGIMGGLLRNPQNALWDRSRQETIGQFAVCSAFEELLECISKADNGQWAACHQDCASAHTSPHCAFRSSINLRRS